MFNLQGSEIIFILLLALVVLGPEKLPGAIRRMTRLYAELRKMSSGFQSEFRSAFEEPMNELKETANLLRDEADPNRLLRQEAEAERRAEAEARREQEAAREQDERERELNDRDLREAADRRSEPPAGGVLDPGSIVADPPAAEPAAELPGEPSEVAADDLDESA